MSSITLNPTRFASFSLRCFSIFCAIVASISHLEATAAAKPIGEPEFSKLLTQAENGSLTAEVQVAKAYASGRMGKVNYQEAARWFRKASDQGDPDSQTNLGVLYLIGQGVERNESEAIRWLQRAAASGYPVAQHDLAVVYLNGWGTPKDPERGVDLLNRSATAGLEISQVDLAVIYLKGDVVVRHAETGIKWLKRAAHRHFPPANFLLGICYENGEGVKADPAKAVELYRKAADEGLAAAQNNLGRIYFQGNAIKQNKQEALRLFSAAAEQGNGQSYLNLALCSLIGCAAVIDATAAYSWYLSAEASGVPIPPLFQEKFTQLATQLDEDQLRRAQSNSQAWVAQHPSAGARTTVQLRHVPGAALAANQQPRTIDNSEVFKSLWQQTPYMPQRLPTRDSVR